MQIPSRALHSEELDKLLLEPESIRALKATSVSINTKLHRILMVPTIQYFMSLRDVSKIPPLRNSIIESKTPRCVRLRRVYLWIYDAVDYNFICAS